MITGLIHNLRSIFFAWALIFFAPMLLSSAPAHAAGVEVMNAKLESTDEGYRVFVSFSFELGSDLKSAINDGIPVSFTAEVEINRPRWYWLDEKTIYSSQTVKIQYDLWRRQYTAVVNGGLKQNFNSLEEAMALVWRPRRWLVADKKALNPGATYNVAVRLKLDSNQLSKPMLITSFSNSDWRLASDWKRFTFKADDK